MCGDSHRKLLRLSVSDDTIAAGMIRTGKCARVLAHIYTHIQHIHQRYMMVSNYSIRDLIYHTNGMFGSIPSRLNQQSALMLHC